MKKLKQFEDWFERKFGWFFTNGMKAYRTNRPTGIMKISDYEEMSTINENDKLVIKHDWIEEAGTIDITKLKQNTFIGSAYNKMNYVEIIDGKIWFGGDQLPNQKIEIDINREENNNHESK
jgi:hypothetical protein